VQTIVDVIPFFRLDDCLTTGLLGFLHPLSFRETLVSLFLHRWILEYHGILYVTVPAHRSKSNTTLIHVNANNRVCISFVGDSVVFVGDSDVEPPLVMLVNNFSRPNSPLIIGEGSP
jgi:hypothetical protein